MTSSRYKRKLSNMRLTKRHHFSYMGLWAVISVCLVVVLNLILYLLIEERWGGLHSLDNIFHQQYIAGRRAFVIAMAIETFLFIVAFVSLARFTAHRIAGPYIRLRIVFDAVRNGNLQQRLTFRDYDHLEELAQAFNDMMSAIRSGIDEDAES